MNTQTKIEGSTELMTPAQIADICEGRDKAIARWMEAYDDFHLTTLAANSAMIGAAIGLSVGYGSSSSTSEITDAFLKHGQSESYRDGSWQKTDARETFEALITEEVDRRCWRGLNEKLGFDTLMDAQAREEFHDGLRKDPPTFNVENCKATFGHLWENRRDIYLRGIANVFSQLDRRFRSHDGFKVGGRIILDGAISDTQYGWWNSYMRAEDKLNDVARVFAELDNQPREDMAHEITQACQAGNLPTVVQGRYFRVRVFKNGNLHIWFERDDLLKEVNKLLAEYYGEVIGDGYNETEADDDPAYHVTPAKNFGAFNTSEEIAARVADMAGIKKGDYVLEPSAGTGMLARAAREKGAKVQCIEIQDGLAYELRKNHGFIATVKSDFLKVSPRDFEPFDVVLMNPPFDRGRDCDHVRHAYEFLKPGGVLVAIMSARAEFGEDRRHRALHKIVDKCEGFGWAGQKWHDLPPGSFAHAGTNVNTTVLTIRKPSDEAN